MTQSVLPLRQRAEQLAAALPPLLVAAEQVASTVAQGVHGRRRVGQGETFWQYRRYDMGDQPQSIEPPLRAALFGEHRQGRPGLIGKTATRRSDNREETQG